MERTAYLLKVLFWTTIMVALVIVVLYETDVLVPGLWADDKRLDFFMTVAVELYVIVSVPLSLRLFKFSGVRRRLCEHKERALLPWGIFRILMLGGAMVVSTILYYLFLNVSFGYLAIILLISMVFVYPSLERCVSETTPKKD